MIYRQYREKSELSDLVSNLIGTTDMRWRNERVEREKQEDEEKG